MVARSSRIITRSALVLAFAQSSLAYQQPHEAKLLPVDQVPEALFGSAVALSGGTALIGAPTENIGGYASGAVYVFVQSCSVWTEQARLAVQPGRILPHDGFGLAVSLCGDTALIGAPRAAEPWEYSGVAYVFARTGSEWVEEAKIRPHHQSPYQYFGSAVSVDGDVALISATQGGLPGRADVFVRTPTAWEHQDGLLARNNDSDCFGDSVSLDGDTALIGSPGDDDFGDRSGAAYVFVRVGTSWNEQARLLAHDGAEQDFFGTSVSLDGDTALIGAAPENRPGVAYVFVRLGTTWNEQAKLSASDGTAGDRFGGTVSLAGNMAVIGARGGDDIGPDSGSTYVFARSGTTWTEQLKLLASDAAAGDAYGSSVALEGRRILVGAPGDDDNGSDAGAAYSYLFSPDSVPYCTGKTNSLGCIPEIGSCGLASASATSGFGVFARQTRNQTIGLLIYGFAGRAAIPHHGGLLCVAPPVYRTPPRSSNGHSHPTEDCSGKYRLDMNAFAAGLIGGSPRPELRIPGTAVQCQWWARDADDPFGSSLSNALEYVVGP